MDILLIDATGLAVEKKDSSHQVLEKGVV